MIRVVLDANVLIAALLSPAGAPARLVRGWIDGAFDLLVSAKLLEELARALAYPKIRARITRPDAEAFVSMLRVHAIVVDDPAEMERISPDPGDDYVIALARTGSADVIVSGDRHLTELRHLRPPVITPRRALQLLEA